MADADSGITIEQLEKLAVKTPFVLEEVDRITARLDFYYERFNEDPVYSSHVLEALVPQSEEEVYKRKIKVNKEWEKLDIGWLESVSYVLIKNGRKIFSVNPEPEEKEQDNIKSILVRYQEGDPIFEINKGSFLLFKPIDVSKIQISSPNGPTKIDLIVMPLG